jgi:hypothetical protein
MKCSYSETSGQLSQQIPFTDTTIFRERVNRESFRHGLSSNGNLTLGEGTELIDANEPDGKGIPYWFSLRRFTMSTNHFNRRTFLQSLLYGPAALFSLEAFRSKRCDAFAAVGPDDNIKVTKIETFVLRNTWVFVKNTMPLETLLAFLTFPIWVKFA